MSLRQIQKQLDKQVKKPEDAPEKEPLQLKKPSTFSAFQMMSDEDNKSSEEETQQDTTTEPTKKKKKRNKKKKNPDSNQEQPVVPKQAKPKTKQNDEDAFLDSIIKQTQKEQKASGLHYLMMGGSDSVLQMDRKHFNYKKELKQLFTKSAQAYGALGLDEEEKEERKQRGATDMAEQYEGASKKQKQRLKMIERLQQKSRIGQGKKCILVSPNPQWPKVEKILSMEQVRVDKKTGQKIFSFVKSPEYVSLEKEFERVQQTNDINNLMNFLQKNFYHHESLLYFADFLRLQGKFSDSFHFLERCLFAFESAWTFDYQPVSQDQQDHQNFVPQVRLDLEKEHLNKVFCDCLVKYIDILGRKGCSRTSLEYCKFLLSISPYQDPYGALLRIDFYALRAHEYQLYVDFVRKLPLELYPEDPTSSLLILPNVLLSVSLAKHSMLTEITPSRLPTIESLEASIQTLLNLEGNLNTLLDSFDPEPFLISALLLYPLQVESLIRKVAQKQITAVTKKAHYVGYQGKSWNEILTHDLFTVTDDAMEMDYPWVSVDRKYADETLNKLYQIYVSRTSPLFTLEHTLMWLKEVIGYVLYKLDEGSLLDRDIIVAKFTSLTPSPFCNLSRYRGLRVTDFTDDITTINANELLMGEQQQQHQEHDQQAQHQLQQMINQLQQPAAGFGNGLIQERQGVNEQDMVAMQEAILAQMNNQEEIFIEEEDQNVQEGGGIMNFFNNLIWGGPNNPNNQEEEKKGQ